MESLKSLADFMSNNFYTGDPNVDSLLFVGLVLIIFAPIFLLIEWIGNKITAIKFERDKAKFFQEVESGIDPDWVPMTVLPNDQSYIDPNCLIRTKKFKEHIKAIDRIVKNSKKRNYRG